MHVRTLRRFLPLTLLPIVLLSTEVAGQEPPAGDESPGALTAPDSQGSTTFGGEISFGKISEDFFLNLSLYLTLGFEVEKAFCDGFFPDPEQKTEREECVTQLLFGFRVPLRFRVIDAKPKDEDTLRKEDWDEVSDYFKIFRFVEYGRRKEPVYVRLGELAGVVIGHGTIMNGYYNTIDIDHFQFGVNSNLNSRYGGVELMMDNVAGPEIFGYRAFVHPWRFFDPQSFWTRYAVGTSLVLDIDAPVEFALADEVNLIPKVDDENNLVVSKSAVTGVVGIDHEILLVSEPLVDFIPYFDTNIHLEGSLGYHLGAFTNFRPLPEHLVFYSRAELRWLGNHYLPDYFSTLYEIERDSYFGFGGLGQPKLVVTRERDDGAIAGAYGEVTADIVDFLLVTGAYEDYQGPRNASLLLRAKIPEIGPLSLGAVYRRSGFNGLNDAFKLDNALLIGEARYKIGPFFYLLGQYSRLWRLRDEIDIDDASPYETIDNWYVGAGFAASF